MKPSLVKGSTDVTVYVFIPASNVSTGAGLTGLAHDTASLVASYVRPRAARAAISLVTQTVTGAHTDGGFVEVDATNIPGLYRLDLPDAACAAGVDSVVVHVKGAANMAPISLEIPLTSVNLNDAAAGGMSRLDAAVSTRLATAGYTAPDNGLITAIAGYLDTEVAAILAAVQRGEEWTGTLEAIDDTSVELPGGHGIDPDARILLVLKSGTAAKGRARFAVYSGSGNVWDVDRAWNDGSETTPSGTITAVAYAVEVDSAQALLEQMTEDDGGTPRFTTNALEQAPTGGSAPSAASIRAEIDSNSTQLAAIRADTEDLQTQVGVAGAGLTAIGDTRLAQLDAAVSSRASASALATTDGKADAILLDTAAMDGRLPSDPADHSLVVAATDAVLAAVGALNNLSLEQLTTSLAAADDATLAQIALVKAKTDLIPAAPAAVGDIPAAAANAAAVLAAVIEGTLTLQENLRLLNAVLLGKASGLGTGTVAFRDLADTKPRVTATTDASGNRSALTLDAS